MHRSSSPKSLLTSGDKTEFDRVQLQTSQPTEAEGVGCVWVGVEGGGGGGYMWMGTTRALLFSQVFNASRRPKLHDVSDELSLASSGS